MDKALKLELKNISFTYPSREERQDFSLNVEYFSASHCTVVMGENGSGKTTLGKLAAGLLRPDSGCVMYNGQDIAQWKLGEIGKHVGYLFQEPARQIFAPTPLEEIAFPMELRGVEKVQAQEQAWEMLRQFELENIAKHTSYTLSRGEKQRLAIAAAMVMKPSFFVLDEPTTGLDKRRRSILSQTLHNLMENGVAIFLISHDKDFASSLGADIRYMDGGRFVDG